MKKDASALATPPLWRRLACLLYEGVLLFGVVMVAGLVYAPLTQQRHARIGTHGLQAFLFLVLGAYFVAFWSRTGQTLAMQTWHVRLVTCEGRPLRPTRALCRYLLAWMWFLPALLTIDLAGLKGALPTFSVMIAGVLAYAFLSLVHPDRQYLHDAVCSTRLISWRNPAEP